MQVFGVVKVKENVSQTLQKLKIRRKERIYNENNYPERQSQKELEYGHDAEKSQGWRRVGRRGNGIY